MTQRDRKRDYVGRERVAQRGWGTLRASCYSEVVMELGKDKDSEVLSQALVVLFLPVLCVALKK